jgi:hypothetical protein
MQNFNLNQWIKICIFNFLFVASLGVLMRYKIGFEFPYLNQHNIQHAHSNFAFSGWITQTIFVLIVSNIQNYLTNKQIKQYQVLLWCNVICSYSLLFLFVIFGYNFYSISLTTISIIILIIFAILFFRHSSYFNTRPATKWFKAALIFALISYTGTFSIIILMTGKHIYQNWYLASVYFYLHFQYNGWFFFSCIALYISNIKDTNRLLKYEKIVYKILVYSCIPAYFLSILWANLPIWIYVLTLISALAQCMAWFYFLSKILNYIKTIQLTAFTKFLFYFIAIAGSIKFLLQLGSTVPFISHMAFGFRPIIIAYLHLVLLAFISMMLIFYMYISYSVLNNKYSIYAMVSLALGVLMNELVLATQGIASIGYIMIPFCNSILFIVALIIWISIMCLFITLFNKQLKN